MEQDRANAYEELQAVQRDLAEAGQQAIQARTLAARLPVLKGEIQELETRHDALKEAVADLEGRKAERNRLAKEISAARGRLSGLLKDEGQISERVDSLRGRLADLQYRQQSATAAPEPVPQQPRPKIEED